MVGSVNPALKECDRKALLGPHIERLGKSRTIITTIPINLAGEPGEFSLWQEGGGLRAVVWTGDDWDDPVRSAAEDLARLLRPIFGSVPGCVQVRLKSARGDKFLRAKGWPYEGKHSCLRA